MTTANVLLPLPPRADFRRRVLAGERLIGGFANLGSIASTEILGRAGFDWLLIDLEHGMGTDGDLHAQLLAVQSTPTAAIVRVPSAERLRVARALDFGADGLMVPRVESVAEATEVLTWMRWPPAGIRGVALPNRGGGYGEMTHADLAARNASVTGVIQLESLAAIEAADEIAAIEGVDVVFVGPADLSHSMGMPGQYHEPVFVQALERVVAACRAHGKAPGILLGADALGWELELGFTFIGIGSDGGLLQAGAQQLVAGARALLG